MIFLLLTFFHFETLCVFRALIDAILAKEYGHVVEESVDASRVHARPPKIAFDMALFRAHLAPLKKTFVLWTTF